MLDNAEAVFTQIAACLQQRGLTVLTAFGGDDIVHVLPEFENEKEVRVLTASDFLTRCNQIGLPEMDRMQEQCVVQVLGKPELSNAIRFNELEELMNNFLQPQQEQQQQPEQ